MIQRALSHDSSALFSAPLRLCGSIAISLVLIASVGCAGSRRQVNGDAGLYERVRAASVEVLVDGRLSGSGWFADAEGLIVTAAHVVAGRGDRLEVVVSSGDRMVALLEAIDRGHDIALLRVSARGGGYPTLAVAPRMPPPGDAVFLFGAPQFRHGVLVRGSVARAEPDYEYYWDQRCYVRIVHVSAPSPHGTSGGCWVDNRARVVGNQSGLMLHQGSPNGLAFVAPTDAVRRLVDTRRSATTPSIDAAVEELWEQPIEQVRRYPKGAQGVIVARAHENGPAAAAGLNRDTLITAVDGKPIRLRSDLLHAVRARNPGESVELTIVAAETHAQRTARVTLIALEDRRDGG